MDLASAVSAAAEEMRKKAVHKEIRTESLPPEVRMVIDQALATIRDHEQRLVGIEAFRDCLVKEAAIKLRGAA